MTTLPPATSASRFQEQKGAVLILIALLCVMLVALLGLAIDSTLISTGKNQQERIAEYAALTALEEYQGYVPPGTGLTPQQIYQQKVQQAQTRAQALAGFETNFLVTERASSNRRAAGPLSLNISGAVQPTDDGTLEFGTWYFAEPPGGGHCLIGPGNTFSPCFEPNAPPPGPTSANAARVMMRTKTQWLYRTLFALVLGPQNAQMESQAIAAFQPRRAVFAIDISGSTDDASHPNSKYAFALNRNYTPIMNCTSVTGTPVNTAEAFQFEVASDAGLWNGAGTIKANYDCFPVTYSDPTGPRTERYLIDRVRRPQPLYSILQAVHDGMLAFQHRAVKGDEVAFLGFDHDLLDARRTPSSGMIKPEEAIFDTWLSITDVNDPAGEIDRKANRIFFGRADTDFTPGAANTYMPGAIREAQRLLASGAGVTGADNFIVMFSDGLTNCYLDAASILQCPFAGMTAAQYRSLLENSIDEVMGLRDTQLIPNSITFNMVLLGQGVVGAHRLVYQSIDEPSQCMSEAEIRRRHLDLVETLTPLDELCTIAAPFQGACFLPNGLAEVATATGGLWAPVIPPCPHPVTGSACTSADVGAVASYLDSLCHNLSVNPDPVNPPRLMNVTGFTDTVIPGSTSGVNGYGGKLSCDTGCRNQQTQIQDVVNALLNGNPYVLVDQLYP